MLEIFIPNIEGFDEKAGRFFSISETKLLLEHSLVSVSEWEKHWRIPFLGDKEKTPEQVIDYIQCMTLNEISDKSVYRHLSTKNVELITDYIKNPMTATTFTKREEAKNGFVKKMITSEQIYGWMTNLRIPSEYQYWHLNRLITLMKVVNLQRAPQKKMGKREEAQQRAALVAQRRAKYNSRG